MNVLSAPVNLWHLYVEYLVNYKDDSWVASIASSFRVLAIVMCVPLALLILLDITSYVIARTLGIIDQTKASTSGDPNLNPTISVQDDLTASTTPAEDDSQRSTPPHHHSSDFLSPTEEVGNLRLSGVDMFSPAPSQPSSPTITRRRHLHGELPDRLEERGDEEEDEDAGEGVRTPRDASVHGSNGSSSGDSSYAILERDSGSEDAGVRLRRRAPSGTDE